MNKVTQFLKKNVFYIAMGIVIIGALVAVLFLPKEGNIPPDSNIQNEQAGGTVSDDYEGEPIIVNDTMPTDDPMTSEEETLQNEDEDSQEQDEAQVSGETTSEEVTDTSSESAESVAPETDEQSLDTQTFESTTVANIDEPFFADGDTFENPVAGDIIVPYTDDSTKYWFSKSLNQTMRTYGVCLAASEGEEVKAVAQGTVLDIITDSTTLDNVSMPYVGKVMIVDLGNGYKVAYGFQNGTPNEDLKGQVVNAGDVLGTVGAPTGAFIAQGDNIYLQLTHDDEIISPENYLQLAENE